LFEFLIKVFSYKTNYKNFNCPIAQFSLFHTNCKFRDTNLQIELWSIFTIKCFTSRCGTFFLQSDDVTHYLKGMLHKQMLMHCHKQSIECCTSRDVVALSQAVYRCCTSRDVLAFPQAVFRCCTSTYMMHCK
jgi:hypothetical protein